ncbi:MAG: PEP-utilizing enzyme, partial [Actinomycetota bacterium]|nr:PEP-utilizing enzyme [Actinomycetota bacterium]
PRPTPACSRHRWPSWSEPFCSSSSSKRRWRASSALPPWSGEDVGIGTVPYTGRACVAADAEEALRRLREGDVLVTTLTTPSFEAVMPIAGAVVTEVGGLMSHTAICCREYGIPAVVHVAGATAHIPDGVPVTVDPSTGRVLVGSAIPCIT